MYQPLFAYHDALLIDDIVELAIVFLQDLVFVIFLVFIVLEVLLSCIQTALVIFFLIFFTITSSFTMLVI